MVYPSMWRSWTVLRGPTRHFEPLVMLGTRVEAGLPMMRLSRMLTVATVAFPIVGNAQGAPFPSTPACPTSARGTEISLGADSVSRRATVSADTMRRPSATQQLSTTPDIILRAAVSAREVRFASQPRVSVRLCGGTLDSVRVLERRNLPTPVVAGTTYRDVYVAIEILGHLTGSCIANTVTGGRAAPRDSGPCAALGLRDSASARRAPPARRPE
jgi:hypothetical protein